MGRRPPRPNRTDTRVPYPTLFRSADGQWAEGGGHLGVLGDSVGRGRDAVAVLGRLHGLAGQAGMAGGAVHVVLGNHEQYMLRANPSRANAEHLHALNAMGGYRHAFAADTMIGEWLRQQPVALKLGSVLFVHGGISPRVARPGPDVGQLNRSEERRVGKECVTTCRSR